MNGTEVIEFINRLKNEYGVKTVTIKECLGVSFPTLRERMIDGNFTMKQVESLLEKWGGLRNE